MQRTVGWFFLGLVLSTPAQAFASPPSETSPAGSSMGRSMTPEQWAAARDAYERMVAIGDLDRARDALTQLHADTMASFGRGSSQAEFIAAASKQLDALARRAEAIGRFQREFERSMKLRDELRFGDAYWEGRAAIERILDELPANDEARSTVVALRTRLEESRDALCSTQTRRSLRKLYPWIRDGWTHGSGASDGASPVGLAAIVWNYCFEQDSEEYGTILIRRAEEELGHQRFSEALTSLQRAEASFGRLPAKSMTRERVLAVRWGKLLAWQGSGRIVDAYDGMVELASTGALDGLIERESLLTILSRAAIVAGEPRAAERYLEELRSTQQTQERPAWQRVQTAALLARALEDAGDPEAAQRWVRTATALLEESRSDEVEPVPMTAGSVTLLERRMAPRDTRRSDDAGGAALAMATLQSDLAQSGASGMTDMTPVVKRAKTTMDPVAAARATAMVDLARLQARRGNHSEAKTLARDALALDQANFGANHPAVGRDHVEVAQVAILEARPSDALTALDLAADATGEDHPIAALTIEGNRAVALEQMGKIDEAIAGHRRVLERLSALLGKEHPKVAIAHHNLAAALGSSGKYDESEAEYLVAQSLVEKVQGEHSSESANVRRHRAILALARDQPHLAASLIVEAVSSSERALMEMIEIGTEAERLAFIASMSRSMDTLLTISVHPVSGTRAVRVAALEAVLQRKGLALEVTARERALLADEASKADLERVRELRGRRARLWFHGDAPDREAGLSAMEAELDRLERSMVERLSASGARNAWSVSVEKVAAALGPDEILLEFVRYQRVDPKATNSQDRWDDAHYLAFAVGSDGEVFAVDLGDAASIEAEVLAFRKVLQSPAQDPKVVSRSLHRRLIAPLQDAIGGRRQWHVAPGGLLALVPFEALRDDERYLIERVAITYATSGRDLVAARERASEGPALVLAAPDFDAGSGAGSPLGLHFAALPGAAREAARLGEYFPDARVLQGAQARKDALLSARSPSILHLATHGFFLGDVDEDPEAGARGLTLGEFNRPIAQLAKGDPMLRSGIALSGANRDPDGILTAAEATSLSLRGTALVVLSACETGVGEVSSSQGTFGLQRSVLLAGAETLVMSLWAVSDDATASTMDGYYRRLAEGGGRSEALRQAKLELLAASSTSHPYFWAPFISLGRRDSLDGRVVSPEFAAEQAPPGIDPRGPRGCRTSPGSRGELLWLGLSWILVLIRRRNVTARRRSCAVQRR